MVKYKRIKDLREDHDYTQEYVSKILKTNRSSYANWENEDVLIPLEKIDILSTLYNVPLSYILGLTNTYDKNTKIKSLDYEVLLSNLERNKTTFGLTYKTIAEHLGISRATAFKYYKGDLIIPIDKLILLAELNKYDIDKLCGKK